MNTCALCGLHSCVQKDPERLPGNCPIRQEALMAETLERYAEEENREFYVKASAIEAEGYCEWPRLYETVMLCKKMGYRKVGLAFCYGLRQEARAVHDILKGHGLEVESVICKTGGIDKTEAGIGEESKVRPGGFEAMCNPVAQARLLNEAGTELNIMLGLCVGHDSLFYKYSDALVTTLVVKDRVLAHNPVAAIYCPHYFTKRLAGE